MPRRLVCRAYGPTVEEDKSWLLPHAGAVRNETGTFYVEEKPYAVNLDKHSNTLSASLLGLWARGDYGGMCAITSASSFV